jgi:hypothetical protein
MSGNSGSRRNLGMIGAALVFAVGALGIGIASGQTSDNTYTGCLRPTGILVKVAVGSEPTSPCRGSATEISWNETGPTGSRGPRGPEGEQGVQGDPGVINFYTVTERGCPDAQLCGQGPLPPGSNASPNVECNPGDEVVGGGFDFPISEGGAHLTVIASRPLADIGWNATFYNLTQSITFNWSVHARCADTP